MQPTKQEERRSAYTFGGFVVLCVTVVLVVLIVNDDWPTDRWIAIGAVGAAVQAIAVTAGVIYGGRQLRLMNAQRRDPAIERLESVYHDKVVSAAAEHQIAWDICINTLDFAREVSKASEDGTDAISVSEVLWPEYERDFERLKQSYRQADKEIGAMIRILDTLGLGARTAPLFAEAMVRRHSYHVLPSDRESFDEEILITNDASERYPDTTLYRSAMGKLREMIGQLTAGRLAGDE